MQRHISGLPLDGSSVEELSRTWGVYVSAKTDTFLPEKFRVSWGGD